MPVLLPHPSTPRDDLFLTAEAERYGTELLLRVDVTGAIEQIVVPASSDAPTRRDELWRQTCFEAFVRPSRSPAYQELNLSPSGDWAYYHFDDRRSGMSSPEMGPPATDFAVGADKLSLRASIDLATLLSPAVPWDIGLAVVLETIDGARSYWALAHPSGAPDFHDPDCFVLHLPPPTAA
ncbi:MAG TPA: DOMON-like domain-containing protein [Allosphingosinicella sp.]|jgi:hypothetical protein